MNFLIAEDHELVSATLKELLIHEFQAPTIHWVTRVAEVIECFRRSAWDLVLLDIELADASSLAAIPTLKEIRPNCRILVFSGQPEKVFGMHAMKAGADGFIHKCSSAAEFVKAIKLVMSHRKYISQTVACGLIDAYQGSNGIEKETELSAREFQVMCSLAEGKFNSEIAAELGISEKTVSTYRTRVLTKLGLRTNAEIIMHALRMGYVK